MSDIVFRVYAAATQDMLFIDSHSIEAFLSLVGLPIHDDLTGRVPVDDLKSFLRSLVDRLPTSGISQTRMGQIILNTEAGQVTQYVGKMDARVYGYLRQLMLVVIRCIEVRSPLYWSPSDLATRFQSNTDISLCFGMSSSATTGE